MPPHHHPDRANQLEGASTHASGADGGRGRGRGRGGGRGGAQGGPGSIPTGSISKLKAQLRQTKRLLAREDLTPDVRTTSERRLKTLELELEKASLGELEKKMVTRYRGVRFFERQKALRKIKQAKKAVATSPGDDELEEALLQARIDLYYILQYPKTSKYVALFPDGTYVPHSPAPPSSSSSKDAASTRAALRQLIRKKIEEGSLAHEAEGGDLGIEGEEDIAPRDGPAAPEDGGTEKRKREEEEAPVSAVSTSEDLPAKKKKKKVKKGEQTVVEVSTPTDLPAAAPQETEGITTAAVEKSARKAKKDFKDQKRREKKAAAAKLADASEKPKGTAFDNDDFFS